MTDFDRTLSAWLHDESVHRVTPHLDEVLAVTGRTRQRPWWSSLERWLPMDLAIPYRGRRLPVTTWRVAAVVALAMIVATAALLVGAPRRLPAPFGLAANGSIVFERDGDIWTSDRDGFRARAIVTGPTEDLGPWFAPDGTRFGFVRLVTSDHFHLVAANPDGTDVRELTSEPLVAPDWWDWSPDGTSIVVLHTVEQRRVLSVLATDGSGRLSQLPLGDITPEQVLWLPPDGRELVFRGDAIRGSDWAMGLWRIQADGRGLERLVPAITQQHAYQEPRVSPDGRTIAYWSWGPNASDDGQGPSVYLLDLGTRAERQVVVGPRGAEAMRPRFSPDGVHLVLEQGDPTRLAVVRIDGQGGVRPIGPEFEVYDNPHEFEVSPDGTTVVLTFEKGETHFIDVMTGQPSEGPAIGSYPTWQRLAP